MKNAHVPDGFGAPGPVVQLTYIQLIYCVLNAPGLYNPIQSVEDGFTMPLQLTLVKVPRLTVEGLVETAGPGGGVSLSAIVTVALFGFPSA